MPLSMQDGQESDEQRHEVGAPEVVFGTPRKLPKVHALAGRVAVLDIAFASTGGGKKNSFERTTKRFIDDLGERLAAWIDHHDSEHHALFADDDRFVLATKAQHGACPEMVTPERIARLGPVETIVCHTDFDGIASAAKWIRGGVAPYLGCDDDARAIDTRIGLPGPVGTRFDRALRAAPRRDEALRRTVLRHLVGGLVDEDLWIPIDAAAARLEPLEREAERIASRFEALTDDLVIVDATGADAYDRTALLLHGQTRARMAAVIDEPNVTFAAAFDSGISFVDAFGLSGGMPTLVSVHTVKLARALRALGVPDGVLEPFLNRRGRGSS